MVHQLIVLKPTNLNLSGKLVIFLHIHRVHNSLRISLLQTLLDRVGGLKHLRQFLQGTILGLREEEVDKDSLKQVPKDKNKVEVVVDVLESRTTAVLDDGRSDRTGEVAHSSALGSDVGRKTLSNVGGLERGPAKGEDNSKDEDHGDGGIRGIAVVGVFDGKFAGTSNDSETARAEDDGVDQKGSTADNIGKTSTENGTEQAQNWVDTVECQDLLLIIDAGLVQHSGEIVRARKEMKLVRVHTAGCC